jgi:hypothetical protein
VAEAVWGVWCANQNWEHWVAASSYPHKADALARLERLEQAYAKDHTMCAGPHEVRERVDEA